MNDTGFHINKKDELVYLTIPSFDETNLVKHCFTTRLGGVSQGVYQSLNTSFTKEDVKENVEKNLDKVCSAIQINYKNLVSADQTHHDRIKIVTEDDIGRRIMKNRNGLGVDALVTNVPGVPLITYYADCVPILILDTIHKAAALVHAGWRGTVLKIAVKTIRLMKEIYNTQPTDCLIGIGPSLEKTCFDVHEDTMLEFKAAFNNHKDLIEPIQNGKYMIDLWRANQTMLIEEGVLASNITTSGLCTSCNEDLFFSYRRDKGKTGSLSAILEIL